MKLQELVSHVIGVDTHKDTHTVAVVDASTGGAERCDTIAANRDGYEAMVELADSYSGPTERLWAIEGTGSYGAGLTTYLEGRGEWVIEVDRPTRPAKRNGAKSDILDAARAAREALGRESWASPRARGTREAMRVLSASRESAVRDRTRAINSLKAMIVSAPDELRDRIRHIDGAQLVNSCARLRDCPSRPEEYRSTIAAIRRTAERIRHLEREIAEHDNDLDRLTAQHCPQLRAEYGVGTVTAAWIFIAWSHAGRCRSEAAFANLAGVAPIEASSGQQTRFRLNRGGDRQLNRALHTVVLSRARGHQPTRDYIDRRLTDDHKTEREARRCLKRYLARHFFRLLENPPDPTP
jgi:transposase